MESLDEWCAGIEVQLRSRIARMPFDAFQGAFSQGGFRVLRDILCDRYGERVLSALDVVDTLVVDTHHSRGCPYLGWGHAALPPRDTLALLYNLILKPDGVWNHKPLADLPKLEDGDFWLD